MRVVQPNEGTRGSLKWMQRAVAERWESLEGPILARVPGATQIEWRSPLASDDFAEYRDGDFLDRLGLGAHAKALAAFWPSRGPQWDALGLTDSTQILLVEAKAHIGEFCTPASQAGGTSRKRIVTALLNTAEALGSRRGHVWPDLFYQLANRLAHLWFLRAQGVDAYLVLVGFVGDTDMDGPSSADVWTTAYRVAAYALDVGLAHPLARYIIHVHPDVSHG